MSDFLLELRSEEIPARMQAGARAELEKLFRRELDAAGVEAGDFKPIVARTFHFADMPDAHRYLESNQQFGKIVVSVP